MKTIHFLLAFSILCIFATACSKDKDEAGFAGVWEGKWGSGSEEPQYFIKFNFKENGEMQRIDEQGAVIATGNWELNGIEFECSYTHSADGQKHRIAGLYTDFDGVVIGTWGYHPSKANGGEIELKRQN